jgi:hypothetical protein
VTRANVVDHVTPHKGDWTDFITGDLQSLREPWQGEKKNQRAAASTNFARRTPRHPRTLRSTTPAAMPALSNMDLQRAAV